MKRKYREAMRAAARERDEQADEEAAEARDWHDEWALTAKPVQEEKQIESEQQTPR